MTPKQLEDLGIAIYGAEWKRPLAKDIGVSYRSMLRYSNGEREIPDWMHKEIAKAAAKVAERAAKVAERLK